MAKTKTSNWLRPPTGTLVGRPALTMGLSSGLLIFLAAPALAHHPLGGKIPSNVWEGFLSGVAHPMIGPDHLAFIIVVGLLAAVTPQGILIPIAFLLSAMVGTLVHLAGWNVPGVELIVAASILMGGGLLLQKTRPHPAIVAGLAAIAGLFHGYAYGEAIFGAETTPLVAYLAGFTVIQLGIALAAFGTAQKLFTNPPGESNQARSAGLVICGVGLAFCLNQLVAMLFPIAG
jgi:urease accessory protein